MTSSEDPSLKGNPRVRNLKIQTSKKWEEPIETDLSADEFLVDDNRVFILKSLNFANLIKCTPFSNNDPLEKEYYSPLTGQKLSQYSEPENSPTKDEDITRFYRSHYRSSSVIPGTPSKKSKFYIQNQSTKRSKTINHVSKDKNRA